MLIDLKICQYWTSIKVGGNRTHPIEPLATDRQFTVNATYYRYLSAKLVLNLTLLYSFRCLISNYRKELFDTHLYYFTRLESR
jgi:hypothetical protein